MLKIIVWRSISSPIFSVVGLSKKNICQSLKFSCMSMYQWKYLSPATIKLVIRTTSNFSKAINDLPFSMKYLCHFNPYGCDIKKPKVDLNPEVAVVFSSQSSSNLFYSENDSVADSLQLLIKPEVATLDDIQVKYNGAVKCQDKNSVISIYNINSIPHLCIQEVENFSLGQRNTSCDKKKYQSVFNMTLQNCLLQPYVLNCIDPNQSAMNNQSNNASANNSNEHLAKIYDSLRKDLPYLFVKGLNYGIYSKDLIFENLINGTKSVGLISYIRQVSFLRLLGHFKYAYVKFDILKITKHQEDSTIRVRWRISGVSAIKSFGIVWKHKGFSKDKSNNEMSQWHDGFSVFFVGSDGLIFKHVADKMMPDEERLLKKQSLISRLASVIGLSTKTPVPQSAMTATELSNNKITLKNNDIITAVFGSMQGIIHSDSSYR